MKPLSEIECAVIDAGTFIPLADTMGRATKMAHYFSPFEQEYLGLHRCCIGKGFTTFQRLDDYMDPEMIKRIDLWIFPDIGFAGLQRYLRSIGKLVWGSMGASDLELYRTTFLKVIEERGLPVVPSKRIKGLTALAEHLKTVKRKWIKVNRYRDDMETWFHLDFTHSQRELERLAWTWGPLKDEIVFVVQDEIASEPDVPVLEVGYDGHSIDGDFPPKAYQGYEKKNQLYLGSLLDYEDLPEVVREVNEAMSPVLKAYGYRNFWATEIRIKDDVANFIDPTLRMAGQTMEHLLKTCTNLPEVIYRGAAGEMVTPEFSEPFAAEATIHYHANGDGGWKTFVIPEGEEDNFKLYRCAKWDGAYHFPPHKSDELGVVIGNGDSIKEAVEDLKKNFRAVEDEPVSIDLSGFADLLRQIEEAEEEGVEFSDQPVPGPELALEKN